MYKPELYADKWGNGIALDDGCFIFLVRQSDGTFTLGNHIPPSAFYLMQEAFENGWVYTERGKFYWK